MAAPKFDVAIIGAGISGLTLALALHQQGISCTVYEFRPGPLNIGGAVMISPNALRILDDLKLYEKMKPRGYNFDVLQYRNLEGDLTDTYEFGGKEKYGYDAMRIYRYALIDVLLAEAKAKEITIRYGMKFSHVIEDKPEGATFAFTDGTTRRALLLVGADGIHSRVRRHLYPDVETKFINMESITAGVPRCQLKLPEGYYLPVTIQSPVHGAFVIAPQEPDGSEVFIGKQRRVGEDSVFGADKEAAARWLASNTGAFPDFVRNAVSHVSAPKVNTWPFYVVPRLGRWASPTRRVLIVGDAAHTVPPLTGQGVNQAFEDVYMLAMLLGRAGEISDEQSALDFWQSHRQGRVDKVLELYRQIDQRWKPRDDPDVGEGSGFVKEEFDQGWLFNANSKAVVDEWVEKQQQYSCLD